MDKKETLQARVEELEAKLAETQKALQQADVFRRFAEASGQGLAMATLDGKITYLNPTACRIADLDNPEDIYGSSLANYYTDEVRPLLQNEVIPTVMQEGQWIGELAIRSTEGEVTPTLENIFMIRDEEGNPLYLADVITDITAQKQVEARIEREVKESTREVTVFRALADNAPYGITLSDPEGNPLYINRALYEMLGYDFEAQEMEGFDLAAAFSPDEYARISTEIIPQLMQTGGWRGEVQYERKDGAQLPAYVTVFLLNDEEGHPTTMVTLTQDIRDRKRTEERLRQLEHIANQSPAVFFLWQADEHWTVEFVSDNVQQFGYTPEDFHSGRVPYASIVHPDDLERVLAEVTRYSQEPGRTEFTQAYRIITQAGETRWTDDHTWIRRDAQGNITHYQGIVLDVTEQKQVEAERERLQQEIIEAQREALQELATPVIPVMDRILVMPLVGSIDSMRARDIMRTLLEAISEHRAKFVILDVTGVPVMDTGVVNHINKTIQAARLKGAQTIVTGISDAVAEAVVDLGIDWGAVETLSDLRTGLVVALDRSGVQLTNK